MPYHRNPGVLRLGVSGEGGVGLEQQGGTDNSSRGRGRGPGPAGYRLLLTPPRVGASRHRQAYKSTWEVGGAQEVPISSSGAQSSPSGTSLCVRHTTKKEAPKDAGQPAVWVVRVWPGNRPPATYSSATNSQHRRLLYTPAWLSLLILAALAEVGTAVTSCKWGH